MRFIPLFLLLPQTLFADPSRSAPTADPLLDGTGLRLGAARIWQPELRAAIFNADGSQLFTLGAKAGGIRVWDVRSSRSLGVWGEKIVGRDLVLSPDGRTLAVGDGRQTVYLFDATDGKLLDRRFSTPQAHPNPSRPFFSPDGKWLAVQVSGKEAIIRDVKDGAIRSRFAVAESLEGFTSDGRWLMTADGAWWNVETGKQRVLPQSDEKRTRRYSPDGRWFIPAPAPRSSETKIELFDAETGKLRHTLAGHAAAIAAFLFSEDGKLLATSGADGIRIWDVAEGKPLRRLAVGTVLAFSRDGKKLAVLPPSRQSQQVWIHDLTDPQETRLASGHTLDIRRVAYSPDGRLIATAGSDRTARLWDAHTGAELHCLKGHEAGIFGISFSADGKMFYTAGHDGTVREWNVADGTGKVRFRSIPGRADDVNRSDYFWAVACDPDGKWLAASNSNASWLYLTNPLRTTPRVERTAGTVYFLAVSPQGKLAMGGPVRDGISIIDPNDANWSRQFGKIAAEASSHDVAFSPEGNYLASTGGELKIWNVETGTIYREFAPVVSCRCVAYSPDGKSLATDCGNHALLWEVATGKVRTRLGAGSSTSGDVNALAYSPDGKSIVLGYDDGTALVRDVYDSTKSNQAMTDKTFASLWKTLSEPDAVAAYESMQIMRSNPKQSIPDLDKGLHQLIRADLDRIDVLIHQLDDDRFAVRERATKELIRIGSLARSPLERAARSKSEEVSLRAKRAMKAIADKAAEVGFPDALRALRALEVVEAIGDEAAVKVLQSIRAQQRETLLGIEATAALMRIEKRKKRVSGSVRNLNRVRRRNPKFD